MGSARLQLSGRFLGLWVAGTESGPQNALAAAVGLKKLTNSSIKSCSTDGGRGSDGYAISVLVGKRVPDRVETSQHLGSRIAKQSIGIVIIVSMCC